MGKYKTYEKYKPSGVDWLGEVPEHWEVRRLKSTISSVINGVWGNEPQDDENDFVCIRVADFDYTLLSISTKALTVRNIEQSQLSSRLLNEGDLLVEKSGGGDNQTVGRVVSYTLGLSAVCSNFIARLTTSDYIDNRFLCYVFSALYSGGLNTCSIKQTTGIQNLDLYSYLCERFCFPPIEEQKSIARFLDRETTRIDTLITKKRQLIDLLQKKRTSIINEAVTKGFSSDISLKNSGISFIGEIPKHWKAIRLKFGVTHIVDCLHSTPSYDENGEYPAIRTADIRPGVLDIENANRVNEEAYLERIARLKPEAKDIIYSREGERFGMAALVPEGVDLCLAQRVMMFRVKKWIDPKFFMWLLNADCMYHQVKQDTVGATSPRVNIGTIVEAWLPIPPKDEQEEIGLKISESCLQIDKIISKIQDHILMIERFRQSLITNSVTGKIDIREEVS